MTITRRNFMSRAIVLGATLAAAPVFSATYSNLGQTGSVRLPSRPQVLVRTGFHLDDAFAAGAFPVLRSTSAASFEELLLSREVLGSLGAITAKLASLRGHRLLGVMDDSTFVMFEEAVRECNGAVLCRGAHVGERVPSESSRHYFASTPHSEGVGTALVRSMRAAGEHGIVQESTAGACLACLDEPAGPLAAPWPSFLGNVLASVSTDTWSPARAIDEQRVGEVHAFASGHSFVSFVIEI